MEPICQPVGIVPGEPTTAPVMELFRMPLVRVSPRVQSRREVRAGTLAAKV